MNDFKEWVFIRPQDVWMFRDSKPFTAGQAFVARSLFPPTPQTAQGFLRTHYLDVRGVDFGAYGRGELPQVNDIIGDSQSLGQLRVAGPFVARYQDEHIERLFSAPLDLTGKREDPDDEQSEVAQYVGLTPADEAGFQADAFDGWRPLNLGKDDVAAGNGWLTETDLRAYLAGKTLPVTRNEKNERVSPVLKDADVFVRRRRRRRARDQPPYPP